MSEPTEPPPIHFRVRPVYHGTDLLVEILDDHRADHVPSIAAILRDALHAVRIDHPDGVDDLRVAAFQDRYFSYWSYSGGQYEIDDDIWALFVAAARDNASVIADIERALLHTGRFVKEAVDFREFE